MTFSSQQGLIQMETFLFGCCDQPFAKDLLGGVVGQFEIVHARVDRRVARVVTVHFADYGQAGLEVGEPARGQR